MSFLVCNGCGKTFTMRETVPTTSPVERAHIVYDYSNPQAVRPIGCGPVVRSEVSTDTEPPCATCGGTGEDKPGRTCPDCSGEQR